ncbi:MAG: hypothetical protein IPK25_00280 [Saprospiraceae bacterium]|nr:hypothetical protein [Saprospiraceae bacterium]
MINGSINHPIEINGIAKIIIRPFNFNAIGHNTFGSFVCPNTIFIFGKKKLPKTEGIISIMVPTAATGVNKPT